MGFPIHSFRILQRSLVHRFGPQLLIIGSVYLSVFCFVGSEFLNPKQVFTREKPPTGEEAVKRTHTMGLVAEMGFSLFERNKSTQAGVRVEGANHPSAFWAEAAQKPVLSTCS